MALIFTEHTKHYNQGYSDVRMCLLPKVGHNYTQVENLLAGKSTR